MGFGLYDAQSLEASPRLLYVIGTLESAKPSHWRARIEIIAPIDEHRQPSLNVTH
jgi:hypothetical protein